MPARNCQNVLTLVIIIAPTTADAANDVHRRNTSHTLPAQCLATPTLYSIYYIHKSYQRSVYALSRLVNADPGIVNADLRLAIDDPGLSGGVSVLVIALAMLYH